MTTKTCLVSACVESRVALCTNKCQQPHTAQSLQPSPSPSPPLLSSSTRIVITTIIVRIVTTVRRKLVSISGPSQVKNTTRGLNMASKGEKSCDWHVRCVVLSRQDSGPCVSRHRNVYKCSSNIRQLAKDKLDWLYSTHENKYTHRLITNTINITARDGFMVSAIDR